MIKTMRKITLIVVHCSAVRPYQTSSADDIDNWHKQRVTHGIHWKGIGYHFVVRRDGTIEKGRALAEPGAHVVGHNKHSIGICYEGGLDVEGNKVDTRTPEQKATLRKLVEQLHEQFPNALIVGHHDLNPGKECPCYDVVSEYFDLQPQ
jgi:N-acetyl-anhydromuramyl-L-alanine amidase AmpD